LTSPPDTALEFHLTSAAWIIGELCERLTGKPIAKYLADELTEPLGLHSIEIGPPVEHQADVANFVRTDGDNDVEVNPWGPWYLSRPEILAAGEPSHSLVATAADLGIGL
jgi:CubicO group peptidase (beta-lactamase class C family)